MLSAPYSDMTVMGAVVVAGREYADEAIIHLAVTRQDITSWTWANNPIGQERNLYVRIDDTPDVGMTLFGLAEALEAIGRAIPPEARLFKAGEVVSGQWIMHGGNWIKVKGNTPGDAHSRDLTFHEDGPLINDLVLGEDEQVIGIPV